MLNIVNFLYKRAKNFFVEPHIHYLKWKKRYFHRTRQNERQIQKAGFSMAVLKKKQRYYAYRSTRER